jgi:hypothetical protein
VVYKWSINNTFLVRGAKSSIKLPAHVYYETGSVHVISQKVGYVREHTVHGGLLKCGITNKKVLCHLYLLFVFDS